jgi:TM2 domain-containing membrane protein YozV
MTVSNNSEDKWLEALKQRGADSDKNWWVTFLLTLFFGFLGAGRFYLGYAGLGLLQICTFGGLGFLVLYDFILLFIGKMKDADGRVVIRPWGNN